MLFKKNIHEKLMNTIKEMLIDTVYSLPYYGEFNLHINFVEQENIGTCGVNVSTKGMNFFYSPSFLDRMSQQEVNFIAIHEDFHLLFNHPRRTLAGGFDHKLSNIAQDMIINTTIHTSFAVLLPNITCFRSFNRLQSKTKKMINKPLPLMKPTNAFCRISLTLSCSGSARWAPPYFSLA